MRFAPSCAAALGHSACNMLGQEPAQLASGTMFERNHCGAVTTVASSGFLTVCLNVVTKVRCAWQHGNACFPELNMWRVSNTFLRTNTLRKHLADYRIGALLQFKCRSKCLHAQDMAAAGFDDGGALSNGIVTLWRWDPPSAMLRAFVRAAASPLLLALLLLDALRRQHETAKQSYPLRIKISTNSEELIVEAWDVWDSNADVHWARLCLRQHLLNL
jgi:hypothetical protein